MADFYIDADVSAALAPGLEFWGHIARTAYDLGLRHNSDDQHLLLAAQNRWIFVTCNRKDFVLLHDAWVRWSLAWQMQKHHAGILIVPQDQPMRLAGNIHRFIQTNPSLMNQLYILRPAGWKRH